jgi:hypothetical protein
MEVSTERPAVHSISASLAGLQAGMVAALWMLAWMGSSAVWQRRSFWTAENLQASIFYGAPAVRPGFSSSTLSGLAVYLLVYSALGCLFAMVVRLKLPPLRLVLASIAMALGWYYLSFHVIWKIIGPLIPLLHSARPTIIGHIIYGAVLARFPRYLPRPALAPAPELSVAADGGEPEISGPYTPPT